MLLIHSCFFSPFSPFDFKVWSSLQSLECTFYAGWITATQANSYIPQDLDRNLRTALEDKYNQAFALVAAKLDKYVGPEGQPGVEFLQHVQFFHPAKVMLLPQVKDLTGVPELSTVPQNEIRRYTTQLGPDALRHAPTTHLDLELFWQSCCTEVPALARVAKRYIFSTINSADCERSFSLYNLLLSHRRRSLSEQSLRSLCFLYYNQFSDASFFD